MKNIRVITGSEATKQSVEFGLIMRSLRPATAGLVMTSSYLRFWRISSMYFFTIITAVLVIGIVWGGLTIFLSRALKYEKLKMKNGKE